MYLIGINCNVQFCDINFVIILLNCDVICVWEEIWSNRDEEWRELWSHVKESRINKDLRLCFWVKEFICTLIWISIVQALACINLLIIQKRISHKSFLWICEREFWITKISIYLFNLINSRFLKILYRSNCKLSNDTISELIGTF